MSRERAENYLAYATETKQYRGLRGVVRVTYAAKPADVKTWGRWRAMVARMLREGAEA